MPSSPPDSDKWLTLSQASKLIGVHSATLREWANQGLIESFQTPGGHRRFTEKNVKAFIELRKKGKGRRGLSVLMDRAISHTQNELQVSAGSHTWLMAFSPAARERQRELGRRLLGVMIQYLARENQSEALLQEARDWMAIRAGVLRWQAYLCPTRCVPFSFSVTRSPKWPYGCHNRLGLRTRKNCASSNR